MMPGSIDRGDRALGPMELIAEDGDIGVERFLEPNKCSVLNVRASGVVNLFDWRVMMLGADHAAAVDGDLPHHAASALHANFKYISFDPLRKRQLRIEAGVSAFHVMPPERVHRSEAIDWIAKENDCLRVIQPPGERSADMAEDSIEAIKLLVRKKCNLGVFIDNQSVRHITRDNVSHGHSRCLGDVEEQNHFLMLT